MTEVTSKAWRDAWIEEMADKPKELDAHLTFWAEAIVHVREEKIYDVIIQVCDDVDEAQARLAARLIVGYLLGLPRS